MINQLEKIIEFLMDYPLKEEPYPEHYPEDLKMDLYPGKDFVVGFCEEAIDNFLAGAPKAQSKEMKRMMREVADLFRRVLEIRQKKLQNVIHT
jgi:hypothetical protein